MATLLLLFLDYMKDSLDLFFNYSQGFLQELNVHRKMNSIFEDISLDSASRVNRFKCGLS